MWLLLAFLSATLLGFYDVFKKKALKDNAVLPVLSWALAMPAATACSQYLCCCPLWPGLYCFTYLPTGSSGSKRHF